MHAAPLLAQNANTQSDFENQLLNPDKPMTDIPDFGVAWPNLDDTPEIDDPDNQQSTDNELQNERSDVATESDATLDAGIFEEEFSAGTFQPEDSLAETGYKIEFAGIPKNIDQGFYDRFESLSALEQYKGDDANFAQIKRRAETDRELVERLLRIEGYYDAVVRIHFTAQADTTDPNDVSAIINTIAGPQYKISDVNISGLETTKSGDADSFRNAFGVKIGNVINSDEITLGRARLNTVMAESGYAFARTGDPELIIDHAERSGDLSQPVTPGGRYKFGSIELANEDLFDSDHLQQIARFEEGDLFKASDVDDLRRALIATGLISTVTLDPVKSSDPEKVDLAVNLTPAPLRTIAGEVGYGTGEGLRTELSWEHRNFFPPEGLIRLSAIAGTQEQSGGITFRRNNFKKRDNILNGRVVLSNIDRPAFAARIFSVSANIERQSNLIYQKRWSWSAGIEMLASQERDVVGRTDRSNRQTFFIGALPATILYDASDDLLDPTKGFRVGARISPEASLQNGSFFYGRGQVDASAYLPASSNIVLAGRVRLGTIVGAGNNRIAPSRRLYSGGGGSVRGYGYQRIGPQDANGDPVGGRSLVEFSLEARIKTGFLGGNLGVVPFFDAGNIYTDPLPRFSGLRYGAGLGVRYYSDFGPIRIDVGTPINRQPGDSRIAVYVSLGQAF
ncbi:MAG: autotransporter assembly complex family protein [Parasphingorhabdus sp.]